MDTTVNHVSCFKWPITTFMRFCERNNRGTKFSNLFTMPEDPSVKFMFSFYPGFAVSDDFFNIILKESKRAVKVQIKLWAENSHGVRYGPKNATHEFKKIEDKFTFNIPIGQFGKDCERRWSMTFCCDIRIVGLNTSANLFFRQRMWAEHQQGVENGVTLKAGEQKHKVCRDVLVCQSSVFKTMLSPMFKEGQTNEIDIVDFDANTIENFVKWLYLGEIESDELALELYFLAQKYLIEDLKDQCLQMLSEGLTLSNAPRRLIWSIQKDVQQLRTVALDFLAGNERDGCMMLLQSAEWIKFAYENEDQAKWAMMEFKSKFEKDEPEKPRQDIFRVRQILDDDDDYDDVGVLPSDDDDDEMVGDMD